MSVTLTARERAHLKSRAHALEPIVHIGHGGVTHAVIAEIKRALASHELIKVRSGSHDRHTRDATAEAICVRTGAANVQQVGKVLVLWRPRPVEDSK